MENQIKPRPLWLGVAVAAGALVAVSGSTAVAAQQQQSAPTGVRSAVSLDKVPKNAVPYHGALPTVGATGAAFAAQTSQTSGGVSPRIVGGSPAQSSAYPGVVGIQTYFPVYDSTTGQTQEWVATCTGTVIASTKVLTAGHCDTDLPFGSTFVIVGRNNLNDTTSGYVARVQSTWTDQNFNLAALNSGAATVPTDDVAVLTLEAPLPATYTPVTLTAQGNTSTYTPGTSATIVGYGETTAGDNTTVGTLYSATVPIQSDSTCAVMTGYNPATMTCAGATAGGIDSCNGDSGGPLLVNGVEAGITDWGSEKCGAAGTYGVYERLSAYNSVVTADLTRPNIINLDFTGDGHSGLMALDSSGNLNYYAGTGFQNDGYNGFGGVAVAGSGWGGFKKVFRVTNWKNDNTESVMAVAPNGDLWEYDTDGNGNWANGGSGTKIGTAWTMFSDIMVVNNWTGDGHADLLGRTPSGDLYLYETNGTGGWLNNGIGIKIGTNWNMFNTVLTPGTWTGDGHQALIGRTPSGDLYLYESDGNGGWLNNGIGIKIGTAWNMFSTFMSPGDWNGDGLVDLIGITPSGVMDLYETDGHGNWLNNGSGQQIGSGWNFKAVF